MLTVHTDPRALQRQRWERIWPSQVLTLIAIGQMLLTFVIIGLETWSMLVNLKSAFLFVGYIAAICFVITWISTFTVGCCNQVSQDCAIHALVENILSVVASSVLLYYDIKFLQKPWMCFWPGKICSEADWNIISSSWWENYDIDIDNAKLIAIKAQLSCAIIMLALCLIFILRYIYVSSIVRTRMTVIAPQNTIEFIPRQPLPHPSIPAWAIQMPVWSPPPNE